MSGAGRPMATRRARSPRRHSIGSQASRLLGAPGLESASLRDEGPNEDETNMQGRSSQAYLVTLWTYGIEPLFADPVRAALFFHVLGGQRRRLGFRLHAYVVLPDRVRLILG